MKKILCGMLILFMFVPLMGCSKTKEHVYALSNTNISHFDFICSDGYDIKFDNPFVITKDKKVCTTGSFIDLPKHLYYIDRAKQNKYGEVLNSNSFYNDCMLWKEDNEWCIVFNVESSNTFVLLKNKISKESALECFDRLTIHDFVEIPENEK